MSPSEMSPPSTAATAKMCFPQILSRAASAPSPPICSVPSVPAFREFIWLETPALDTICQTLANALTAEPSLAYTNSQGHVASLDPLGLFATRKVCGQRYRFCSDAASCQGMRGFVLKTYRPRAERSYEPHSARTSPALASG